MSDGPVSPSHRNKDMNATKYNGWTNYETWLVKHWMDNEQSSQEHWSETAQAALASTSKAHTRGELGSFTIEERAALNLADVLKDHHEEMLPPLDGFASDLLNSAFSGVNWFEIAQHLITDAVVSNKPVSQ